MIPLDSPHCDWLTLTTFDSQRAAAWLPELPAAVPEPEKRLQYEGTAWHADSGSLFVGSGDQRGKLHYITQASGWYADQVAAYALADKERRRWRCTRIDLAITARRPADWSQAWLWAALRSSATKRALSIIESLSGPNQTSLATVYIGSRKSRRFVRVYEKPLEKSLAIRFEVEYKGDRARKVWSMLARGAEMRALLAAEVNRLGEPALWELYGAALEGVISSPTVAREEGDTERWLVHTVLPALERYLQSHGNRRAAERIRLEFLDVLTKPR